MNANACAVGHQWADDEWAIATPQGRYAAHHPFDNDKGRKVASANGLHCADVRPMVAFAVARWHELAAR